MAERERAALQPRLSHEPSTSRLRTVDLNYFAAAGVSPFALLGYIADPREAEIPFSVPMDLGFTVSRERVRFPRGRRFVRERDCQGEADDAVSAYLIPAIEGGHVVDWVAWHPRSGRIATHEGRVGLLGGDALWRASRDEPLLLVDDPRAWLAGWRTGACIVDEGIARAQLLEVPAIQAPTVVQAEVIEALLRQVRLPSILVPAFSRERAAA